MDIATAKQLAGLGSLTGSSNPAGNSKLGKDEFVKLLMAQMSYQNPLSPVDGSAFVAQLAQFANVEQLQSANGTLESLLVSQASSAQLAASALVGKDVVCKASTVKLETEQSAQIQGRLEGAASSVSVTIRDSAGRTVRTIQLGAQAEGPFTTTWDGRDANGDRVAAGEYSVQLTAADTTGKAVPVEQRVRARVQAVSFQNGYPELIAGALRIKLADVAEIAESQVVAPQ